MMIIGNICYINNIDDNRMMIVIVVVMVIIKMIYSYFNNKTMVLAIMIMV
jgi:hypothetical protein